MGHLETIAYTALDALRKEGAVDIAVQKQAMQALGTNPDKPNPTAL
jgi:hypothetical protein